MLLHELVYLFYDMCAVRLVQPVEEGTCSFLQRIGFAVQREKPIAEILPRLHAPRYAAKLEGKWCDIDLGLHLEKILVQNVPVDMSQVIYNVSACCCAGTA